MQFSGAVLATNRGVVVESFVSTVSSLTNLLTISRIDKNIFGALLSLDPIESNSLLAKYPSFVPDLSLSRSALLLRQNRFDTINKLWSKFDKERSDSNVQAVPEVSGQYSRAPTHPMDASLSSSRILSYHRIALERLQNIQRLDFTSPREFIAA